MADAARADHDNAGTRQNLGWLRSVPKREFTYKDYKTWGDDIRVELIDGLVYMMASPGEWHQWVLGNLFAQLSNFLKGKKCTPYVSPFQESY